MRLKQCRNAAVVAHVLRFFPLSQRSLGKSSLGENTSREKNCQIKPFFIDRLIVRKEICHQGQYIADLRHTNTTVRTNKTMSITNMNNNGTIVGLGRRISRSCCSGRLRLLPSRVILTVLVLYLQLTVAG